MLNIIAATVCAIIGTMLLNVSTLFSEDLKRPLVDHDRARRNSNFSFWTGVLLLVLSHTLVYYANR